MRKYFLLIIVVFCGIGCSYNSHHNYPEGIVASFTVWDLVIQDQAKGTKISSVPPCKRAQKLFEKASTHFLSEPDKAQNILEQALELCPEHKQARADYHVLQRQSGAKKIMNPEREEAMTFFEKSNKVFDSDPEQAERYLRSALKLFPDLKEAQMDLLILKNRKAIKKGQ
jgi:tetratricopeptide (TPR) repeat protein